MNKVILNARVGQQPETMKLNSGEKVANFSVAYSEKYKNKSGDLIETTDWFDCKAFKGTAEFIEKFVNKGARVLIEGKLQKREWEDKNGGGKRYKVEVLVQNINLFDWPDQDGTKQPEPQKFNQKTDDETDDLPF